ncbi:MAG: isoprenylcysteine carboxylmethyltransferase family protein [Vicinamibacterales bacterium]
MIRGALWVAAWPALMFAAAGDLAWPQAWGFTAWLIGLYALVTIWMHRNDPALLAERRKPSRSGQSAADRRAVLGLFAGFAAWIVLMPLDARRFRWSPPLPVAVQACGAAILLASGIVLFRAFYDNTFLSGTVRIQSDRQQTTITTGAYAFVRHPMYLGIVLMFFGAPLLLGSVAGLIIAAGIVGLLVARIAAEEQLLDRELAGYTEYRQAVRYRLLPGVW